jgi:ComF family protein
MNMGLSIQSVFQSVFQSAVSMLLPRDCFLCGAACEDVFLCADCSTRLPTLPAQCCPVCALPTPMAEVCGACLQHAPHFDATHALWRYDFPIDKLVQSIKYSHRLSSVDFFAQAMAQLLEKTTTRPLPDWVLPVPLSAERLRERGFNQSVELARPLARALGVPLELHAVQRPRHTAPQAGLPWKERAKNIRHAFECLTDFSGKTVLVIDDVMTTGATLNELARVLKMHGAVRVENCVVARTLKDD